MQVSNHFDDFLGDTFKITFFFLIVELPSWKNCDKKEILILTKKTKEVELEEDKLSLLNQSIQILIRNPLNLQLKAFT